MEGSQKVANLAVQFDDLCKGFNHLIEDFHSYAGNQEDCRRKWLEAEEEIRSLKIQLHEMMQVKSKMEALYENTCVLLKNEVKARTKLQEEKRALENRLKSAREVILSAEQDNDEVRAKLNIAPPVGRRSTPGRVQSQQCDWLGRSHDASSTESSLTSYDLLRERKEEELEMSHVRSSRASTRTKRTSEELYIHHTEDKSQHVSRRENAIELSGSKRLIATTTVTIPKAGPITTTSVIETEPESTLEPTPGRSRRVRIDSDNATGISAQAVPTAPPQCLISPSKNSIRPSLCFRRSASVPATARVSEGTNFLRSTTSGSRINQRRHVFSQKTIIKSENCLPCGNRIKFGKPALKCSECRGTCHLECKALMPVPCIPTTSQVPATKGFTGTVADYVPSTSPMIPGLIVHCINEVERRGYNHVGIYRVNGSEKEIKDIKDRLLSGKAQPHHLAIIDIHVVTGTLKLFLRSLKEPLITFTLWLSFSKIADLDDEMDVETTVYSLVPELPQPNRDTLAYVILHLQRVADTRDCKMPIPSLARIFGPVIVGHSVPDPDPQLVLKESKQQHLIMEKLLKIPCDYWNRFILNH